MQRDVLQFFFRFTSTGTDTYLYITYFSSKTALNSGIATLFLIESIYMLRYVLLFSHRLAFCSIFESVCIFIYWSGLKGPWGTLGWSGTKNQSKEETEISGEEKK